MERFKKLNSLAGELQPGDGTRYELVAVETWDTVEVVVMNEGFFDKITFLKYPENFGEFHHSFRGEKTNPWTVKAAKEMFERLLNENCSYCIYADGGACSNCKGVDGATEISGKFRCENFTKKEGE